MTIAVVKERPILFSAPMVRAILDGRKTQTRRPIKRGHVFSFVKEPCDLNADERRGINASPFHWERDNPAHPTMDELLSICPYGAPGDRMWMREAWGLMNACYGEGGNWATVGYRAAKGRLTDDDVGYEIPLSVEVAKRAYDEFSQEVPTDEDGTIREGEGFEVFRWRPSIHMPRWASRITLEVVSVRVQRVQEISEADAIAEGLDQTGHGTWRAEAGSMARVEARDAFEDLWDSINAKRGHGWAANPWVWVVEFKALTGGPTT